MTIFNSDETGTWHARFISDHGERSVDTGATTLAQAKERCALAKIEELEKAAAVGRLTAETLALIGSGEKVTISEALDDYEKWASQERAPKTVLSSLAVLRMFAREANIEAMAPGQVKSDYVTAFINRPHLKLSTRKVHRACISGFFQFCTHKGWMIGNPAARATIHYGDIPLEQKERKAKELFSPVEIEFLIGRLTGFWRSAVILSSELGLRLSDVCNLEWASFDFKRGLVTLWMEKTNERLSLRMTPTVKQLAVSLKQTDKRWVFPEQRDTWERSQSTLSHQFKRACGALNLPGRSFHGLRASYATHEYVRHANAPVNEIAMGKVAADLGHRSTKTTADHYVRISNR